MEEVINWKNINFIGEFDNRWVLTKSAIVEGKLVMQPGGKAVLEITEGIQKVFQYIKVINDFSGSGFDQEMNYVSQPRIGIGCVYQNINRKVTHNKYHTLGFNVFDQEGATNYVDETRITTMNKDMKSMRIVIQNSTDFVVTINSLRMYQSKEVTKDQVLDAVGELKQEITDIVYDSQERMSTTDISIYKTSDGRIDGLELALNGTEITAKLKFQRLMGVIVNIQTNFSEPIAIKTLEGPIDLENQK